MPVTLFAPPPFMLRLIRLIGLMGIVAMLSMGPLAQADTLADVTTLHTSGKNEEALKKADEFLATKPRDAPMRFLRGVILMDLKRDDDAMAAFTSLTQEFPNLAEPYNNLGVLLSKQSRFDEARIALETALRNNPSFALAQENLGDVYAALAAQAYARSSQLDPANATAPHKLVLVRQLLAHTAS